MTSFFHIVLLGMQVFLALGDSKLSEECRKQLTCGDCIQFSPECTWCGDFNYFGQRTPKCNELKEHIKNNCNNVSNPLSDHDAKADATLDDKVKVSPQNLTLRLRPGQPTSFKVKVRMPENYPVDLYYLMDLSGSMNEDIKKVKTLGQKIAQGMEHITKKFRLGFGAFVDKPLAPYINTHPIVMAHPDTDNLKSVPAFGFKNMLPLSTDPTDFEKTVASLNISGNVDNPEGGMDALVQVAVCEKKIGWQSKLDARRLVILCTDSGYHFAGDGLLGGVIKPNDGKCHLDGGGTYTASTIQDFPSVGFVREVLLENQVAPIFAITKTQVQIYEHLAGFLGSETGAVARRLNNDSSNVVPLVREAYLRIAQTQTVTDNAPDGIKIKYTANCPDGKHEDENTCTGVKIGEEVSFDVSVTATDCSKKQPGFSLKTAFGDVNVKLEYICDCECEKPENADLDSPSCSGNGSLSCGLCKCNEKNGGRSCGCSVESVYDIQRCESNGSATVCSGRGKCVCGECICTESKNPGEFIYGKQCECTNMDCPRDPITNLVCGGAGHGSCDCGVCTCVGNWTGPDCMCTKDIAPCIDENGVLCSGRGTCECGKCVCNETSSYKGTFCNDCPTCGVCTDKNKNCVECWVFNTGKFNTEQCKSQCGDIDYRIVEGIQSDMGKECQATDNDDCKFFFAYRESADKKLVLYVKKHKECPEEAAALAVILGVVLGVLGVGLALLLIWKLLATIQDRREFAKFEKERQEAKWDTGENPIFKQATTTFQNPTYGGK